MKTCCWIKQILEAHCIKFASSGEVNRIGMDPTLVYPPISWIKKSPYFPDTAEYGFATQRANHGV